MDRIDQLRLFVRIVERRSFTVAAHDIGLPRSTATQAIRQLEERLGTRLLERTTRQVTPTLDGQAFYERCGSLLADIDEVENAFRASAPQGPLRVDMQGTLARFFVLPALPDFTACYPEISLRISEGDRMVDLVREGVDCVLRAGTLPNSSLVGKRIAEFQEVTCASPDYLSRYGEPQSIEDLSNHRMVAYVASATGQPYPLEFAKGNEFIEVALPSDVTVTGAEIYTAAAVAGFGLIQVPRYRIARELVDGSLKLVLPDFLPPRMPVWVLYPQNRQLSARVRVFVDWLSGVFADASRSLAEH
jgi:DNA-binding transcriptional LysR family regulator